MPLSINITLAQLIAAFIFGRLKMILVVLLLLASAVQGKMSNFNYTLSFFLCGRLSQLFSCISESRTTLIRTYQFFFFVMKTDSLIKKKLCIRTTWLIRPELMPVSMA